MMTSIRGLEFDPQRLRSVLRNAIGGAGEISVVAAEGGQSNPTFFVTFGKQRIVLRKKPTRTLVAGAHAIEREYRVLTALAGTNVPVPRPIAYCDDLEIVGTPFYLMERIDGRVFQQAALAMADAQDRRAMYSSMVEALAQLHAVNPETVGLGDFGRPGNYFVRQFDRWRKQWVSSSTGSIPALDKLSAWLAENLPQDDGGRTIVHGDYRFGNLVFHKKRPEVVAILDWELATLGDPLADLGFACLPWHSTPSEYGGILGLDHEGLGLPSQQEFVREYERMSSGEAKLRPFHIAFALFRFAVIFVGIAERARDGIAASDNAAKISPLAARFAMRGLEAAGVDPLN